MESHRPALPAELEPGFVRRRRGRAAALVRVDFAPRFDRMRLLEAADRPVEEIAPELLHGGGRGPGGLLDAGKMGKALLRPYRRGGLARRFSHRRYLLGDRAFDELAVTEQLRHRGVPAPEVLAAVQSRRRPGYRAALVTRLIPGARTAAERLRGRPGDACRPILRRMGRSVGRLHEAGGWHRDLNATNFLVTGTDGKNPRLPRGRGATGGTSGEGGPSGAGETPVYLLDFDRGRLFRGRTPRVLARWSLRRLRRSLRKLGLREALAEWGGFEEGYAEPSLAADPDPG